jgi:hypothetical protein
MRILLRFGNNAASSLFDKAATGSPGVGLGVDMALPEREELFQG